jgi:uncharacterized protein YdbL (DUF1318 family)
MRISGLSLAIALLSGAAVAQTPTLDAARASGAVGERFDGYMGVAGQVSATVRNQVSTINIQRRSLYTNLAAQKGIAPSYVGLATGCQLLARLGVGEAYMLNDKVWRRRAPGQPAPAPDYCR